MVQVSVSEEAAEVGIAAAGLAEEREVVAVRQSDLGAGDGLQSPGAGTLGELHGAVQAIVISKSQRLVDMPITSLFVTDSRPATLAPGGPGRCWGPK